MLEGSTLSIRELVLVATEGSAGESVVFRGQDIYVETDLQPIRGLDLTFLCVPEPVALDWIRKILQAKVPCIDLTGALSANEEVPLLTPGDNFSKDLVSKPIVSANRGVPLACYLALEPLENRFGLKRVGMTVLDSASGLGKAGADVLQAEVVALFNQGEMEEPQLFPRNMAFDSIPKNEGAASTAAVMSRILPQVIFDVNSVQVPMFSGNSVSLIVETRTASSKEDVLQVLEESSTLEVWGSDTIPSARDSSGKATVLVGGVHELSGDRMGIRFWISADVLLLSVAHAIALAELRYGPDQL